MKAVKHPLLAVFLATCGFGCSEQAGSPVGEWDGPQTTVIFHANGIVDRNNWSLPYHPDYLAPLEDTKSGTWKTTGHRLFLTATQPDGTTATRRYNYSVRTGSNGAPEFKIEIPEGPDKSSFIFTRRERNPKP